MEEGGDGRADGGDEESGIPEKSAQTGAGYMACAAWYAAAGGWTDEADNIVTGGSSAVLRWKNGG